MAANLTFLYFYADLDQDEKYMYRCLQLARLGEGYVAPNPMVGAVLVHNDHIIGEGYHRKYGEAHAEVNCLASVKESDRHLIAQSVLYVSLEPCNHFGQTPPCTDLIIRHAIAKVVIGCRDPFVPESLRSGQQTGERGIEKLESVGIKIKAGVLEKECRQLNKRFFTFHTLHRPYIILKWAQTLDGRIATLPPSDLDTESQHGKSNHASRLMITNGFTNRMVHQWRSQEMSILVGTKTALLDDPELSTRLWPGQHPIRMVIDRQLGLPASLKLFDGKQPTIVFNTRQHTLADKIPVRELRQPGTGYYQITEDVSIVQQVVHALYRMHIQSVLVEGGSYLLQSFIDEGTWDEARVITNESLLLNDGDGLPAPSLNHHQYVASQKIFSDVIRIYSNCFR